MDNKKLSKLREKIIGEIQEKVLENYNLDSILLKANLSGEGNFEYVLQYPFAILEHSLLVIDKDNITLFSPDLEIKSLGNVEGIEIRNIREFDLKEFAKKRSKVGLDFTAFSYKTINTINEYSKALDISEDLEKLREIKKEEELYFIERAVEITKKVF